MDNALFVGTLQRRRDLSQDLLAEIETELPLFEACVEALTLEEFKNEVGRAVGETIEVVDLDDVGVPKATGDLGLSSKARERVGIFGDRRVKHLDRNPLARQPLVVRLPNRAHAAPTQDRYDLVGAGDEGTYIDAFC